MGKLEETTSMEILNNKERSFSSKRRRIPTGYWTWVRRFFFLRFAEYWYMTIQNHIFINLWTISTESVSWGLLSSDCGPQLPPRKVSASPVLFFFVLLALQDPEKRFSIIECVNHMFFQKIRNTHLEDTKWQLQSVDVSCQLKWCQPGCLANGFSSSGSCWNSPSIATWMEWGRASGND